MDTESIDLRQKFQIVRKRLWLIILIAFFTTSLAGIYTFFWVDPVYKADVLVYIWQSNEEGTDSGNLNTSDLALFSQLVNDYEQLAKSRLVTTTVADELGLDASQAAALAGQISVSTKQNTRLLLLTVHSTDPQFAASAANKLADVFSNVVVEKMNVGSVNLIDEAVAPRNPVSPNKQMNLAIGLVLGIMIGVGLTFLIEMLDTRVRTTEQVATITDYPLLGIIPEFNTETYGGRGRN